MIYKKLLEKGFEPTYFIDKDFLENTLAKSRLFYILKINNNDLLQIILNKLDVYDKYFWIFLNKDLITQIEIDENVEELNIRLFNVDIDNIILKDEQIEKILDLLPNKFNFNNSDE